MPILLLRHPVTYSASRRTHERVVSDWSSRLSSDHDGSTIPLHVGHGRGHKIPQAQYQITRACQGALSQRESQPQGAVAHRPPTYCPGIGISSTPQWSACTYNNAAAAMGLHHEPRNRSIQCKGRRSLSPVCQGRLGQQERLSSASCSVSGAGRSAGPACATAIASSALAVCAFQRMGWLRKPQTTASHVEPSVTIGTQHYIASPHVQTLGQVHIGAYLAVSVAGACRCSAAVATVTQRVLLSSETPAHDTTLHATPTSHASQCRRAGGPGRRCIRTSAWPSRQMMHRAAVRPSAMVPHPAVDGIDSHAVCESNQSHAPKTIDASVPSQYPITTSRQTLLTSACCLAPCHQSGPLAPVHSAWRAGATDDRPSRNSPRYC